MGKGKENTRNGETIVHRERLHPVMLAGPATLMIFAGLSIGRKGVTAVILLALATIWGIFSSISLERSEIVLTRGRLLVRIGFPWQRSYDFPLEDIESVHVYQPSLGRFLDFGKITVTGKNGKRRAFRMVRSPIGLTERIYECARGLSVGGGR
ncbi:MAG: PH domain-containing protein [Syntrophorhabdales bacterium]|jgi:hypothetical protein